MKKMNELPISEMPYEKCARRGARFLSDAELLAVILRTGSREKNSLELAQELLTCHPTYTGLHGLCHMSYQELVKIKGIGKAKAVQILSLMELSKRLLQSARGDRVRLRDPADVAEFFMAEMRDLEKEHLYAAFLDASGNLLHWDVVFVGTIQYALANPREILRLALTYDAAHYVILHNHPSGDPTPSPNDIQVTKKLIEASTAVNIPLADHIVIGHNQYVSFRERGLMK
ncbi:MAG: DNA repair protein RadC [Eubacterium sp.]|nr:DNA repair protein RadC [Eubacterium sp.]